MSGTSRADTRAQLAVMDAMVFFAVCAVISASLASSALHCSDLTDEPTHGAVRADELLSAYLRASLGEPLSVEPSRLELTGLEPLSEVLFVMASLLTQGREPEEFSALSSLCSRIIVGMCGPWSPVLRLSASGSEGWATLIEIGAPRLDSLETWSATKSLGESGGSTITVTLVLFSTLLLHDV